MHKLYGWEIPQVIRPGYISHHRPQGLVYREVRTWCVTLQEQDKRSDWDQDTQPTHPQRREETPTVARHMPLHANLNTSLW